MFQQPSSFAAAVAAVMSASAGKIFDQDKKTQNTKLTGKNTCTKGEKPWKTKHDKQLLGAHSKSRAGKIIIFRKLRTDLRTLAF